jgi:hypothetical protein
VEKEWVEFLAKCLVAEYRKTVLRWYKVWQSLPDGPEPSRCRAEVASVEGRRVFTMTRPEWERFRADEGKLIEIELERTPTGGLAEASSVIAALAADCHVERERIEVWPYDQKEESSPFGLQTYLVLENFVRELNLSKFAERARTQDTAKLRKHLREHVFIVKGKPEETRRRPKPRSLERIVFLKS